MSHSQMHTSVGDFCNVYEPFRHGTSPLTTCQTPDRWTAGERRALAAAEVTTFAESVHKPTAKGKQTRTTAKATK
jgi:hypothetical protein